MNREARKQLIREQIIQSLYDLLKEKRWDELSSNDICKKAAISKRTLYRYFQSQDDMYLELVKRSFVALCSKMEIGISKGETAVDKICNLGMAYLSFMQNCPIESSLIVGFDERKYIESNRKKVEEIGLIANQFELIQVFHRLDLDPAIYDQHLAIFLWGHIQGVAQLINSKGAWLEHYYGMTIQKIIETQVNLAKQVLLGVEQ
ncbi:TetR/AcrR family transcriptional regulator [Amphibacillus sediminis]|uniref:TetR/AcrR family transcriptional regulator n=1 Tax=Amphibacillus sediminis TaxID=360185 RepID=UPI000833AEE3|nr:TetR/AcrR family transcriptional regulator [Amphibacillus sediminis]